MTSELFTPDPENLNQAEEEELTYRLMDAVHEFEEGPNGKCVAEVYKFCYEHEKSDTCQPCNADSWSVLHYRDDSHDHGGYDCMCFEGRDY